MLFREGACKRKENADSRAVCTHYKHMLAGAIESLTSGRFSPEIGTRVIAVVLIVLVVHDQLTYYSPRELLEKITPAAAHPAAASYMSRSRSAGQAQASRGSVMELPFGDAMQQLQSATLEEARLLLNATERALPYAAEHLARARHLVETAGAPQPVARSSPVQAVSSPPPPSPSPAATSEGGPHAVADEGCQPTLHAGFNGGSLNWGMTFKVESAQQCCDACRAHAKVCSEVGAGGKVFLTREWEGKKIEERCASTMNSNEEGTKAAAPCNVFVYCPTPLAKGGLCWSNDVWNHSFGECWLKNQRNPARPEAGAYGAYPAGYRKKHHTAPDQVQWMSGSLATTKLVVDGPKWHW